jgi:hypothetical protein
MTDQPWDLPALDTKIFNIYLVHISSTRSLATAGELVEGRKIAL